mgnify:CR=1 FL=1
MIHILNQIIQQLGGGLTPQTAGTLSDGNATAGESASSFAQSLFSFLGEQPAAEAEGLSLPAARFGTADQTAADPHSESPMPDGVLTPVYPHMWLHSSVLQKGSVQPQLQSETGETPGLQVLAMFKAVSTERAQSQMALKVVDTSELEQLSGNTAKQSADLRLVDPKGNTLPDLSGATTAQSSATANPSKGIAVAELIQLEELAQTETGRTILQQIAEAEDLPEGIDLNKVKAILDKAKAGTDPEQGLKLHRNTEMQHKVASESKTAQAGLKLIKSQTVEQLTPDTVLSESKVTTDEMTKRATLHDLQSNLSVVRKEGSSTSDQPKVSESSMRIATSAADHTNTQTGSGTDQNLNKQASQGFLTPQLKQNPATLLGEGSFDFSAIDHELKEGTPMEHLSRISADFGNRQDFANRISRIISQRFMPNNSQSMETFQQHTFVLDDGEALQVAARQSEAGLSLQLGSGSQELMRLIQQHSDEIRAHLKNELNIEIDLQLKQDSDQAQAFGREQAGSRDASGKAGLKKAEAAEGIDNHSDTRLNTLYMGFNKNEWVG